MNYDTTNSFPLQFNCRSDQNVGGVCSCRGGGVSKMWFLRTYVADKLFDSLYCTPKINGCFNICPFLFSFSLFMAIKESSDIVSIVSFRRFESFFSSGTTKDEAHSPVFHLEAVTRCNCLSCSTTLCQHTDHTDGQLPLPAKKNPKTVFRVDTFQQGQMQSHWIAYETYLTMIMNH